LTKTIRTTLILLPFIFYGCSTVCPEGLKFGLYGAMCAPYETYQLLKDIKEDLKPGGMLNPHGSAESSEEMPEDTDDK